MQKKDNQETLTKKTTSRKLEGMIPGMKPHYEDLEVLTEEKECDSGLKENEEVLDEKSRTKKK